MGEGKKRDAGCGRENRIQHMGVRGGKLPALAGRARRESRASHVERLFITLTGLNRSRAEPFQSQKSRTNGGS